MGTEGRSFRSLGCFHRVEESLEDRQVATLQARVGKTVDRILGSGSATVLDHVCALPVTVSPLDIELRLALPKCA